MTTITGLTDQPKQQSTIVLPDGSQASIYLEYRQQQAGWFVDVSWQNFTATGLRLTASPNYLRKWQNLLPFGLSVLTKENVEPTTITDFVDGTVTLLLLTAAEVALVNVVVYPGN